MATAFSRFHPRLQEAIANRLGWTALRPVQELSSHAILNGKNAVVLAPTAGGKTEASMFPLLSNIMADEPEGVGLIYIAPIKALLNNQAERLGTYTEMVGLRRFLWHGDVTATEKRKFIQDPATLLMTTPESLEVMLLSSKVPDQKIFRDLRAIVIDEVHALAGSDRGTHLLSVLERLARHTDNDVQRIGLSATVGNPTAILTWLQGTSQRQGEVIDPPKQPSSKELLVYLRDTLGGIATEASAKAYQNKSLFFCQSRALSEDIAERMRDRGTDVFVHHSSVSLEERTAAEERFSRGSNTCIVCTSTLELGIDVGDLDLVLQANAASTVASFLQRLGRTGRRPGQRANTTFYCEDVETVLQAVAIVELARKGWVESVPVQTRCWPVLVHQLLALTLQFGAISPERCWQQLSAVSDFSGISREEFDSLLQFMEQETFLFRSGGLLSMGDRAEKVFGRKNFMELYAVFSSPQLYKVQTQASYKVGTLEQSFVDKLVPEMSSFLLGGRAWTVTQVNHGDRTVQVTAAPRGKKPTWSGFAPQLLSFELCQQIADLIRSDQPIPFLDPKAQESLTSYRRDVAPFIPPDRLSLIVEEQRAILWTFAGGKINHTLKYGFQLHHEWKVVVDNFRIRLEGEEVGTSSILLALERMAQADFWEAESTQKFIMTQLPHYRLSKFQPALPDIYSLELIWNYLLDVRGALKYLLRLTPPQKSSVQS